jgi:YVTN family beta-propeller protein
VSVINAATHAVTTVPVGRSPVGVAALPFTPA